MTATTQPDVVDRLLTGMQTALTDKTIQISDGYPPGAYRPTVMVSVGGLPSDTVVGTQTWAYLGAKTKEERYTVEFIVSVIYGGDGQQAEVPGADAQKAARDACYAAVHLVEDYLVNTATPALNQYFNTGSRKGGWAGISGMKLHQTDDQTAALGAIAECVISYEVYALI